MKKITQVSIVYMVAALMFAQPVAQGITLNQFPTMFQSAKSFITFDNCIKGAVVSALVAFVGYIFWQNYKKSSIMNNKRSVMPEQEMVNQEVIFEEKEEPSQSAINQDQKLHYEIKATLIKLIESMYRELYRIVSFKDLYLNYLQNYKVLCENSSTTMNYLVEFEEAFKSYCKTPDDASELRIKNSRNKIIAHLNQE